MNARFGNHTLYWRWALLVAVGLCLLALVVLLSRRSPPKAPLWIRFEGLSSNSLGWWDYTAAVPKPERYDAVVFWSVGIEETNKTSVPADTIVRAPTNSEPEYGFNEEGITTYNIGPPWDTNKVYRVIGYFQPGNVGLGATTRYFAARHCPSILRFLPEPRSIAVTSQWTVVTTLLKPF